MAQLHVLLNFLVLSDRNAYDKIFHRSYRVLSQKLLSSRFNGQIG